MITEQDAIEQYVATRISQPFNWTNLTIVELVRADRITLTSASKSLTDEVREFESIEDWQDAFGEDLFPAGFFDDNANLPGYFKFIELLDTQFRIAIRDRL